MLKRQKRRYIAAQISADQGIAKEEFVSSIWRAIEKLFGEYGASKTNLIIIAFDSERKLAVMRVMHSATDMVHAALASITNIGGVPASVHVLKISGTLKALGEKIGE